MQRERVEEEFELKYKIIYSEKTDLLKKENEMLVSRIKQYE